MSSDLCRIVFGPVPNSLQTCAEDNQSLNFYKKSLPFFHPLLAVAALPSGLSFSIPLMAILLAHEMGHYLTARYHGVPTSLPYFIPAPPFLITGTFGAFIRMKAMPRTRRVMFDIGAAGPQPVLKQSIGQQVRRHHDASAAVLPQRRHPVGHSGQPGRGERQLGPRARGC